MSSQTPEEEKNKEQQPLDDRTEGNRYDKIIQENLRETTGLLLRELLNVNYSRFEILHPNLQKTLERKADLVLKIHETGKEESYIMQVEFQSQNSKDMLSRMITYFAMLFNTYRTKVRQHVIYMGKPKMNLATEWVDKGHQSFRFQAHDIRQLKAIDLLNANKPEEVILAILADFGELPPEEAVRRIILRLRELEGDQIRLFKYIEQADIFSRLRNLSATFDKTLENMPIEIDETELTLYKRGQAKGRLEGKAEGRLEGKAEGRLEGKAEGRLEGKAEGEAEGINMATEVIFALQIDGKSPEGVAQAFGLPLEKVVAIQSRFQGKK